MEKAQLDIYGMVTNKMIKLLEQDIIPWRKPWHESGIPKNLLTLRPYRGINLLLLGMLGYKQNYFLSFDQVKALGGSVKRDEKAQTVVFWKYLPNKDENEKEADPAAKKQQKRLLRYYNVFNVEQCTGLPSHLIPDITRPNDPIALCEGIIENMPNKPRIQYEENEAYYHPGEDYVNMPDIEYFVESEAYYATFFHELVHSTGHASRLDRKELTQPTRFGTDQYSTEELIAELGSCYLQSYTGRIYNELTNSAAYIQGWLAKLNNDKRCIMYASNCAQKACDYILDFTPEYHVTPDQEVLEPELQVS